MHKFMEEALIAFERLKKVECNLNDTISDFALRYEGQQFREIVWDLSILFRENDLYNEAFLCVERLITYTDDPEPLAQFYMTLGQVKESMNDFEAAILYYLHAKSLNPTNKKTSYFIHNNLGYCFNLFRRYEEAEGLCRTAINIDAERHNAYKNLGRAMQGKGQFADAARNYVKAANICPADSRALTQLMMLVLEHGEISNEIPDIHKQLAHANIMSALSDWD